LLHREIINFARFRESFAYAARKSTKNLAELSELAAAAGLCGCFPDIGHPDMGTTSNASQSRCSLLADRIWSEARCHIGIADTRADDSLHRRAVRVHDYGYRTIDRRMVK
jgi:hypothetical protein